LRLNARACFALAARGGKHEHGAHDEKADNCAGQRNLDAAEADHGGRPTIRRDGCGRTDMALEGRSGGRGQIVTVAL